MGSMYLDVSESPFPTKFINCSISNNINIFIIIKYSNIIGIFIAVADENVQLTVNKIINSK